MKKSLMTALMLAAISGAAFAQDAVPASITVTESAPAVVTQTLSLGTAATVGAVVAAGLAATAGGSTTTTHHGN
ncbi:MAG: hypothetical protein ACK4FZ_06265 [Vogesella sp.]|uniref:hypothetical protein n=1 Tax=Vogesella sp. TaxID=1904252 RepID=UPI00391987F0